MVAYTKDSAGRLHQEFRFGLLPQIAGDINASPEFVDLFHFVVSIPPGHPEIIMRLPTLLRNRGTYRRTGNLSVFDQTVEL